MSAIHTLPEVFEDTPERTLVLAGDDREMWKQVLPMLDPVYVWYDKNAALVMVRWRMTPEVMAALGISPDVRCQDPGCTSCDRLLHCDDHDVYLLDTNWHQTGWCFGGDGDD